jgi:uncharacterized protein (TIGR02271 family)
MEQIQKGMVVYSSDRERLGKVVAVRAETIIVEKGFFFPTDYTCRTSDIESVNGDEVVLRLSKAELQGGMSGGRVEAGSRGERRGEEGFQKGQGSSTQEVTVPVTEEELDVQKRGRKSGEVRVSKRVTTEQKQVTVPVSREEVRVERMPAGRAASRQEAGFASQDVSVPVMEEEVVVSKRPVVREEVRISKQTKTEQRPVSAQVRREEVDIEQDKGGEGRARPALPDDPDARH